MITINKVYRDSISSLIEKYNNKITVPFDDMWENMVLPSGSCYEIKETELIGYFIVDENDTLLQFYVDDNCRNRITEIFEFVLKEQNIKSAFVGTFESQYLALCLDKNAKVTIDTFLYKELKSTEIQVPVEAINIEQASINDYAAILEFCENKVGLSGDWMKPYYQNLLPQGSVYLFKIGDEIIGVGELRPSNSSIEFANLGMMVSKDFRKQNIGTYIMNQMKLRANKKGLIGICSTTFDNIASQKAIQKSGFYAYHRILKVEF